jgi:hypothetical protein
LALPKLQVIQATYEEIASVMIGIFSLGMLMGAGAFFGSIILLRKRKGRQRNY